MAGLVGSPKVHAAIAVYVGSDRVSISRRDVYASQSALRLQLNASCMQQHVNNGAPGP